MKIYYPFTINKMFNHFIPKLRDKICQSFLWLLSFLKESNIYFRGNTMKKQIKPAKSYTNLSPEKRKFIEFIKTLNPDRPKPVEIAKQIGISLATYYKWLKDSELIKIAEQEKILTVEDRFPDIMEMLVKKALQGDIRAINTFLKWYEETQNDKNDEEKLTPDMIINIIRNADKDTNE